MEQETQEQTNKFNNKIYYILPEFSGKVVVCHHQKLGFKSNDWWSSFDELLALPLHLRYNRKVRVRPIACGDKNEYIVLWIE